jgi:hypothetical protein
MEGTQVAATALVAIISSTVTYLVQKTLDQRRARRNAGRIEVLTKRRVELYDVLNRLLGLSAALHHSLWRIKSGGLSGIYAPYESQARDTSMRMRKTARSAIGVIGGEMVTQVEAATDRAIVYVDAVKEGQRYTSDLFEAWDVARNELIGVALQLLRRIDPELGEGSS